VYLVYHPEGDEAEQRWAYDPLKLRATEREMLERQTGENFTEFTGKVLQGNARCRRALLFLFLRREHPRVKFDDVDFGWDELRLEYSRQELGQMREQVAERMSGDDRDAALARLDQEIETAYDDADAEGKARLPIAD
jgi:hypothetical protein